MTETEEATHTDTPASETSGEPQIIADALAVIDEALGGLGHRELVSSDEVTDVLLDVRALLRRSDSSPAKSSTAGPLARA